MRSGYAMSDNSATSSCCHLFFFLLKSTSRFKMALVKTVASKSNKSNTLSYVIIIRLTVSKIVIVLLPTYHLMYQYNVELSTATFNLDREQNMKLKILLC